MGPMPVKILTVCKHGLVRSVALADVLKLHFELVDVIPVGYASNSQATFDMLCNWANFVIFMEERYIDKIHFAKPSQILVCEVGQDRYGNSHNKELIEKCWNWTRQFASVLGIQEHNRSI